MCAKNFLIPKQSSGKKVIGFQAELNGANSKIYLNQQTDYSHIEFVIRYADGTIKVLPAFSGEELTELTFDEEAGVAGIEMRNKQLPSNDVDIVISNLNAELEQMKQESQAIREETEQQGSFNQIDADYIAYHSKMQQLETMIAQLKSELTMTKRKVMQLKSQRTISAERLTYKVHIEKMLEADCSFLNAVGSAFKAILDSSFSKSYLLLLQEAKIKPLCSKKKVSQIPCVIEFYSDEFEVRFAIDKAVNRYFLVITKLLPITLQQQIADDQVLCLLMSLDKQSSVEPILMCNHGEQYESIPVEWKLMIEDIKKSLIKRLSTCGILVYNKDKSYQIRSY